MITRTAFPLATFDIDWRTMIVSAEFTSNVKIDLSVAKEIVMNRREITNDQPIFLVIEFSNVREITPEAKDFLLRKDGGAYNILGVAFLANNPVSALIANIFIKSKNEFPSRYFSTKANAMQWIAELRWTKLNES
jgi:hypothetical protein